MYSALHDKLHTIAYLCEERSIFMIARKKKPKKTQAQTQARLAPAEVVQQGKKAETSMEFQRGKETRSYTPARAMTGDTRYGKDNPDKPDPKFIEDARKKKQDIAYDAEGKSYRAGYTTTTKEPDKFATEIKVTPTIRKFKVVTDEPAVAPKSESKIKQMSGRGPKRRLQRVKWLPGRNKKTEAGYG